jgi:predicted MFS family arabinose efflux permease
MSTASIPVTSSGVAQRAATRAAFFVCGFGISAWAPLVPYAKARLNLDDGSLGLLLLCLGTGSMVTMPVVGALAGRHGCRVVIVSAAAALCAALPCLAMVSSPLWMAAVLAVFGAGVGGVDVAVNVQSVAVEAAAGRPMMSGFHGLYSVGGIAGSAGVSAMLWLGASPLLATGVVVAVIVGLLAGFGRHLLGPADAAGDGGPAFAWPRGIVLVLGVLCFIMFMAEGSVLDWAAVFLTSVRGLAASHAGIGYACFAGAMTVGRLNGDRVVHALGGPTILRLGGLLAAAGFAVAVAVPWWPAALVGFAMVGFGASNIVPVLTSTAGRQTLVPPGVAISTIASIGYVGILTGPAAIGFLAHRVGLPLALLAMAAAVLVVAASGRVARR